MSRAPLLVVPAVALLAALLATAGRTPIAVAVGIVAGVGLWAFEQRALEHVTQRVGRWGKGASSIPLRIEGGSRWRAFGETVNELGAALRDARAALRDVDGWIDRLVDALEEPALLFGEDGRMVAANEAARTVLAGAGGAVEQPYGEIAAGVTALAALGSSAAAAAVEEAHATGRRVALDEERGTVDLHVTAAPLDDYVLVTVSDRTRARRVEALRRDFVTNASHELKTPVTAIQALVDAMAVAGEDRRPMLVERLGGESQRLVRLVHDLLDLRMLDEGAPELALERVDLVTLVGAAAEGVATVAAEREVSFELELPASAVIVGVERELRLVVDNLVANAVHYNVNGGRVTVAVRSEPGWQVLTVGDTGIGIPRAAVDRIFERFYRVDVARSRERGGTGLGLSIVRNAVERHGGSVSVESLLGDGTTFVVRLPVQPPA